MAVLLLGGCGLAQPYVYDQAAYDREHPDFAKMPKHKDDVTVCYSKYGTRPAEIARLAAEACGRYGAGIQFIGNAYSVCPMATPVGAQFACVGDRGEVVAGDGRGVLQRPAYIGTPGQPGAPLSGFDEGARPMGLLFGRGASSPAGSPLPDTPPALPNRPDAPK